ncbi:MAG: hypothetical protein NC822_05800 [Candidatus Omnitrophica bacterium]|nr:hypothetical protein [Candidatus Omnitrophota bacterium]MCM8826620.1 hypothetical protein [Candidatus Omnitrophota bacterium]
MVKKLICIVFLFLISFFYLHQKINIYVEAYKLDDNRKIYNDLVHTLDDIRYHFYKRVSLSKINLWLEKQNFDFAKEKIVLVLNKGSSPRGYDDYSKKNNIETPFLASYFFRFFNFSIVPKTLAGVP